MNFLDLNTMVDDRAEASRRALGSLLWGFSLLLGCCLAIPSS